LFDLDLTEAAGKLSAANYEKKADIEAALASSTAAFQALEAGLAAKKNALDADLQRELASDAAACDAYAKLVDEFQAFAHSVKTAMQVCNRFLCSCDVLIFFVFFYSSG